jgi:hypothetical protein
MTKKSTKNTEAKLEQLGFKKKWLDDKSSYWFEKSIKKLFKGKELNNKVFMAYVDPAPNFNQYQIQYVEKNSSINFLDFNNFKSMHKFIKKNGKL